MSLLTIISLLSILWIAVGLVCVALCKNAADADQAMGRAGDRALPPAMPGVA
jgi:hypothetical protein